MDGLKRKDVYISHYKGKCLDEHILMCKSVQICIKLTLGRL